MTFIFPLYFIMLELYMMLLVIHFEIEMYTTILSENFIRDKTLA